MSDDPAGLTGHFGERGGSGKDGAAGTRRGWAVAVVALGLPASLLAALIAVPAALWSRLPARVADHWTLSGTANGTAPRLTPFLLSGVLALLGVGLAALGWAWARGGAARRGRSASAAGLIAVGLFVIAISTGSAVLVAVANLGGDDQRSASVGASGLVGLVGGPVLLAAAAGYLLRRHGGLGATDGRAPSTLGLRPGERAVWTGRARAGWASPTALALLAAGALIGALTPQWPLTVVLSLTGVLVLGFTSVRVTVAARGLTIGYGALGLRLTRIPLRKISSAEAVRRGATSFGYRGSLLLFGAAAVVLRPGDALRLTLRDGKTFLVTVDDAATGAALLNDLIGAARNAAARDTH
jgi:hypothetical protein